MLESEIEKLAQSLEKKYNMKSSTEAMALATQMTTAKIFNHISGSLGTIAGALKKISDKLK